MDLLDELSHVNLDPALLNQVRQLVQQSEVGRQQLAAYEAKLADREQRITERDAIIRVRDTTIQHLTLEIAYYRRIRFANKSESFSPEQRDLFQETWDTDMSATQVELEQLVSPADPKKRRRAGRQPIPEHLPRIEHRHKPDSSSCAQCGRDLVKLGEDVSEQLDVEPARFFVHRHIRPQYACRHCDTIVAAPIPPAIIDGGMASAGLLSWVAISKFADHLPLYRLEQIAARQNVPLPRSTLADWVGRLGVALQPLADRLAHSLRQRTVLHADETPVAQLDPGKGKTKRAYLWAYRSNDLDTGPPIVVFDYQTSRSGQHARAFLNKWQGHLMVDDYAGYKALFGSSITELACLAHIRRKFFDLYAVNTSPIAADVLKRIGQVYAIEADSKKLTLSQRQTLRCQKAKPLLESLHAWLLATRHTTAPGSALAKAIDYSLKRWNALIRYADTGHLPIDNNPVENTIRPIALGKKNWMFVGSERAGVRAAAIQSLLGTAKLNGLDPQAWLKDTLEKLPAWPNSRIDELLPFAPP